MDAIDSRTCLTHRGGFHGYRQVTKCTIIEFAQRFLHFLSMYCHCFFSFCSCVEFSATDKMISLLIEISDRDVADIDRDSHLIIDRDVPDFQAEDGVDA